MPGTKKPKKLSIVLPPVPGQMTPEQLARNLMRMPHAPSDKRSKPAPRPAKDKS